MSVWNQSPSSCSWEGEGNLIARVRNRQRGARGGWVYPGWIITGDKPSAKTGAEPPTCVAQPFLHPAWMQGAGLCPQHLSGASPSSPKAPSPNSIFWVIASSSQTASFRKWPDSILKPLGCFPSPCSPHTPFFFFLSGGSFKISLKVTVFIPQPDLFAGSLNPVCSLAELSRAQRYQKLLNKAQLSQKPERANEIGNNWNPAILAQT